MTDCLCRLHSLKAVETWNDNMQSIFRFHVWRSFNSHSKLNYISKAGFFDQFFKIFHTLITVSFMSTQDTSEPFGKFGCEVWKPLNTGWWYQACNTTYICKGTHCQLQATMCCLYTIHKKLTLSGVCSHELGMEWKTCFTWASIWVSTHPGLPYKQLIFTTS